MPKVVTYKYSKIGYGSLRIVKGFERRIYISDTNMGDGQ